jgi:hypothetical protein
VNEHLLQPGAAALLQQRGLLFPQFDGAVEEGDLVIEEVRDPPLLVQRRAPHTQVGVTLSIEVLDRARNRIGLNLRLGILRLHRVPEVARIDTGLWSKAHKEPGEG